MSYQRYQIETEPAPNLAPHPHRFKVQINRLELSKLLLRELVEFRGDLGVVLSRPCVYGVFSGPLGGFLPRQEHCVGCLRCTVQYPKVAQIHRNPERFELGDSYFGPDQVDAVLYEAASGRVPVRGAGYGGGFGGTGWDSMWTDMSEIVRPTRDGIHGREYISTAVELGSKPRSLRFDGEGNLVGEEPRIVRLEVPILFDPVRLENGGMAETARSAAQRLRTLVLLPLEQYLGGPGREAAGVVLAPDQLDRLLSADAEDHPDRQPAGDAVPEQLDRLPAANAEPDPLDRQPAGDAPPPLIVLDRWDTSALRRLRQARPQAVVGVQHALGQPIGAFTEDGPDLVYLNADYHGRTQSGFALQAIRDAHQQLVDLGIREQLSLIGSGGIIAAEHVPKAIISGLDAVALDTALAIALQGRFLGECRHRTGARIELPEVPGEWAVQRLVNLVASWRDQLLEILGAMGLREVRRLRGEVGRAMFQADLEREAFGDIPGFGG